MRRIASCLCLLVAVQLGASVAWADELSDFEAARRAYENQDYTRAARGFESLVGGVVPRATDLVVRLESRKYLGATYLFLGKKKKAKEQFRLLLGEDDSYTLNPLSFPNEVVKTFNSIRKDVRAKNAEERRLKEALEQEKRDKELQDLMKKQERIRKLEEMAASETVEQVNSRWVAILPFGVGQFRNEHRKFGIVLAVTESAFLVGSIVTFLLHNSLRNERPSEAMLEAAQSDERALRIANWASVGGFAAFYIAGVIDAQVRFKPVIQKTRIREIPADEGPPIVEREFQLRLGLSGVTAELKF